MAAIVGRVTGAKKEAFLRTLRATANVSEACKVAGLGRTTAYVHRKKDEAFAEAWDDAVDEGLDVAEGELYRRAVEGVDKPVFYAGAECGSIRTYSDSLLIFLLKSKRSSVYGEKQNAEVSTNSILVESILAGRSRAGLE